MENSSPGRESPLSNVLGRSAEECRDHNGSINAEVWSTDSDRAALVDQCGAENESRQRQSFQWNLERSLSINPAPENRTLHTFSGVFSPVALSMFSTVLFLRLGLVVGQSGVLFSLLQFVLAYFILALTILSISAISTNGAVEGGGAYYMISRALGPEFGGSIGLLFFLANIFSCALYIAGFVEGLVDNFQTGGDMLHVGTQGIPSGNRWLNYAYCSAVLAFCLVVCLIGGTMFARTSVFILAVLLICTLSVVVSMFIKHPVCVPYPKTNQLHYNGSLPPNETACANYTGFSTHTFADNLYKHYTKDYLTGKMMSFAPVFAVLFSSVTGIMNGANMSGELRNPSKAIPRGTLAAACFTLITYLILVFLVAATCDRALLTGNYNFLQSINAEPPFVVTGMFAATLSAALGNLIGSSRVLEALAKDNIFWMLLRPATVTTAGGNPYVAVLISWFLVQLVLLIGSLNAIAPLAATLFLLSYASTNLATFALDLASAPNFRPTFKYFSWHTALLGMCGCLAMCFVINYMYAFIAIACLFLLVIVLHMRTFETSWGSISQALIFHQVRKYLLLLDSRKDHIKFWRPQMLLLISNPRSCCELIDFINDIKKGGLYVLGHVHVGELDRVDKDPCQLDYPKWLSLVDSLKIKAFVELTLASSIREGIQHLVRVSGLGGMKPNTICLGFYDNIPQEDTLMKRKVRSSKRIRFYINEASDNCIYENFPQVRSMTDAKSLGLFEYVAIIYDAVKLRKNVCLFRHFNQLNKDTIFKSRHPMFIDVWPLNFFCPETANYLDNTCLFMLQLACILHMVPGWKKKTVLRIFMCTDAQNPETIRKKKKLGDFLQQLRILGLIKIVPWEHVMSLQQRVQPESDGDVQPELQKYGVGLHQEYIDAVNQLIRLQSIETAVTFMYLPKPPQDSDMAQLYLGKLDELTKDLPPTILVNGIHTVTSTTL